MILTRQSSTTLPKNSKKRNDPVFIFKEVVRYLHKNRVILPGYTVLQDIIGKAITAEEKRLTLLLNKLVKQDIHKKL